MKIKEIKNVFDKYACQYNFDEILIKLKYEHSYRVMNICKEIAEDLNLGKEDVELAMVIGLLHDYARFEQWKQFKTFNDAASIDHGDLAVEKLFKDNEIDKFNIPISYYQTIYNAIKYHNKYEYPKEISERDMLFCKLIKDADKLDIFYLISVGEIKIIDDASSITQNISDEFYEEKLLRKEYRKTNSDRIIFSLAMMYDLNFKYSYEYLKDNKLVEKIFDLIMSKKKFEPYFSYIDNFIDERSKEYVRKKI